jgi:hypothetical protein
MKSVVALATEVRFSGLSPTRQAFFRSLFSRAENAAKKSGALAPERALPNLPSNPDLSTPVVNICRRHLRIHTSQVV